MDFLEKLEFEPNKAKEDFFKTGLGVLKKGGKVLTLLNPPTSAGAVASTKLKGDILDTVERVGMDGSFKYYGNWGGPLYSAGRYYKKDEAITKDDIKNNPPQDKLDELFLKHDLRYQRAVTNANPEDRKRSLRYADELFIKEAQELLKSGNASISEKIAGNGAILAFKTKLATDVGYNSDYLDDPNARSTVNEYFNEVDNTAPIKNDVYVYPSNLLQNQIEMEYNVPVNKKIDNINEKLFERQKSDSEVIHDIENIRNIILALIDDE